MEAVVYSNFRSNLKDYMKKVNDEFTTLMVVNKNPDEDIVVVSRAEWESTQETLRILNNQYLREKLIASRKEIAEGKSLQRELIEV
ncbi:MAG: type II toxin-antitoxin system Phd/YefM family antitoxin [Veillonella sp.]|uniref:type II toxin-antitoxin system Phd/YefM family antitoxin n=1 Tax=Veillonella caviae TaxID=248316 RepID=UPI000F8D873A|nr:type II toxin-antitoxin system prevent-host-death family antitoxin [Veillonella caviae]MCF0157283.1 type II toxin-antitoxin system Phd/YefM family antitoxin [Veillonella sp.]